MNIDEYIIEKKITYEEGPNFFKVYLNNKNIITSIYFINIAISIIVIIIKMLKNLSLSQIMANLGFVIFVFVPYSIFHESLHLLGYIIIGGGKKISIGIDKGIFYSVCNKYIISNKKYMFVALLPSIIISTISIFIYFFIENTRGWICIFYLVQLLSSNIDIAIASYCKLHNKLYYYEDKSVKEMYFLKKKDM